MPETKGKELEDLDEIFNGSTKEFAAFHWKRGLYVIKRHVLGRKNAVPPPDPGSTPMELRTYSTTTDYAKTRRERD